MSDIMRPIPFGGLMNWILTEYRESGSVFGVSKLVRHENGQALPMFKEKIESPYGPAAGPHTQLAQNIVAAYAAGARFFELKTVQVMDGEELSKNVNKPCITAGDECYNCEWSTELTVPHESAPYKDKFTLFWSREDFESSGNSGFLRLDGYKTLVRLAGSVQEYDASDENCGLGDLAKVIRSVYDSYSYLLG